MCIRFLFFFFRLHTVLFNHLFDLYGCRSMPIVAIKSISFQRWLLLSSHFFLFTVDQYTITLVLSPRGSIYRLKTTISILKVRPFYNRPFSCFLLYREPSTLLFYRRHSIERTNNKFYFCHQTIIN
jgi:hypothetical protein